MATAQAVTAAPPSQGGIIDRLEREIQANGSRRPKPDSLLDLDALAVHAVCEAYTKDRLADLDCSSGEETEAAKAQAALTDAQSSWLAAINCLPAV